MLKKLFAVFVLALATPVFAQSPALSNVAKLRQIHVVTDPAYAGGAKCDGVSDDTAAFQAALNTMVGSTNATGNVMLKVPAGTCLVSATLSPPNSSSAFTIKGDGLDSTIIKWNGAAAIPMFKFINARHVYLDDLSLYGKSTAKPSIMVEFNRAAGLNPPAGAGVGQSGMRRVRIGDGTGDHTVGVKFSAAGGQDSNNEQGVFEDVEIIGSATYAYHFSHSNSLLHRIVRGNIASYGTAAINNDSGGAYNASFDVEGTTFSGNANTTLFHLAQPRYSINIRNAYHENTAANDTRVVDMVGAWTGGGTLNFFGGQLAMGDITIGGTYTFDFQAADSFSTVNFYNTAIYCPATCKWRLQGAGSTVNFFGGSTSFATFDYSTEVTMYNTKQGAGAPTYTNLGGGVLNVRARSKGSNSKDVTPAQTAGTTIDASGNTGDTIVLGYGAPANIDRILNGYIGQRITLVATSDNQVTLVHDNTFTADRLYLRGRMNKVLHRLDSITLERMDATSGGSEWLELFSDRGAEQLSGANVNVTAVNSVGAGPDNLIQYTLLANAINTDAGQGARGVRITSWGTTANNANAKVINLLFGAANVATLALTAGQISPWRIQAEVMWTAGNAQKFISEISQGGAAKQTQVAIGVGAEVDTGAIVVKGTSTGVAAADVVHHGLIVELIR